MSQSAVVWLQFLRCAWRTPVPKLLVCLCKNSLSHLSIGYNPCQLSLLSLWASGKGKLSTGLLGWGVFISVSGRY